MAMTPQPPTGQIPQKVIRNIQRKLLPSGRVLELRDIEMQWICNGSVIKDATYEMEPEAADGTLPKDLSEVNECCVCLGIFSNANLATCTVCGQYCSGGPCRIEVPPSPELQMGINTGLVNPPKQFLCRICHEESQMTLLDKLRRFFWRL
jgi:hypothetical protein